MKVSRGLRCNAANHLIVICDVRIATDSPFSDARYNVFRCFDIGFGVFVLVDPAYDLGSLVSSDRNNGNL